MHFRLVAWSLLLILGALGVEWCGKAAVAAVIGGQIVVCGGGVLVLLIG